MSRKALIVRERGDIRSKLIEKAIASDSDGSGEAGETRSGSTEGDSAGPKDIAQ